MVLLFYFYVSLFLNKRHNFILHNEEIVLPCTKKTANKRGTNHGSVNGLHKCPR